MSSPDGKGRGEKGVRHLFRFSAGKSLEMPLGKGRQTWLQVVSGRVSLNGHELAPGDGAAVTDESKIQVTAQEPAEALLFDLA